MLATSEPDATAKAEIGHEGFLRPAERAYAGIRDAILSGRLAPGAHLREEPLAALTGASRTPVREALRRLVAEGLAIADHRHRYVADFSYAEVVIVFDLRARMEGYAARVAAPKIGRDELERIAGIIEAIDDLDTAAPDADRRFVALNAEMHRIVLEAARSPQLIAIATPALALPLVMIKQYFSLQRIDIRRSNAQHRDILAALAAGNGEWAENAMRGHILSTKPRRLRTETPPSAEAAGARSAPAGDPVRR